MYYPRDQDLALVCRIRRHRAETQQRYSTLAAARLGVSRIFDESTEKAMQEFDRLTLKYAKAMEAAGFSRVVNIPRPVLRVGRCQQQKRWRATLSK